MFMTGTPLSHKWAFDMGNRLERWTCGVWTLGLLKQPGQCLQENRGTPAQGGKRIRSRHLPPSRTQLPCCSCYLYPWFLAVPSPTLSNPSLFVPVTLA